VDGAVGRFNFKTHFAMNGNGVLFDSSQEVFTPLKPNQFYLTTGFKELAMITGDTEQSFRKTSIWLNLIRYQQENGTPHRTLHDQTWKEGTELMDHLKKNADDLNHGNFDADGVCINPDISRGGKPITQSMDKIQRAISDISTDYNPIELLNNPVIYEEPSQTVNISIDDVTPKRQKDTRESPKVTEHDRKYVHDTVTHIGFEDTKYVLTGDCTKTCLGLLNAFLLHNSLFGKRLQIFTDGHKALNAAILKHFNWYENIQIILDWFHLCKKFKEGLSMAMKGRDLRNAALDEILPLLWNGLTTKAILYLEQIPSSEIKNEKQIHKLIEYLNRNKPYIPNYELRKRLKLRNSSNVGEKMNDIAVSNRQKKNGMSWVKKGSLSLATLTTLKMNNEYQDWFRNKEVKFKLVA
jgi:hypothetical protein